MTTKELIEKSSAGDLDALEKLLLQFRPRIDQVVSRQAGVELLRFIEANDMVQTAMTSCFRSIKQFSVDAGTDAERSFEAWLTQIAVNAVRQEGRKRRRALQHLSDEIITGIAAHGPRPSGIQRRAERLTRLSEAIGQLAERDRRVVELRLRGRTVEQTAEQLGLTPGAVDSSLARAKAQLRELLGGSSQSSTNPSST